ncbi:hypothetical protein Tco_1108899 [Tanacetum coccineum]
MSTCPLSHCSGVPGRAPGMSTCPLSHCSGVPGRSPGGSDDGVAASVGGVVAVVAAAVNGRDGGDGVEMETMVKVAVVGQVVAAMVRRWRRWWYEDCGGEAMMLVKVASKGSKSSCDDFRIAKSWITCVNINRNTTLSEAQGVSLRITSGVRGLHVADSHTGNHPEDDFTPLETIRITHSTIGKKIPFDLEREAFEPKRRVRHQATQSNVMYASMDALLSTSNTKLLEDHIKDLRNFKVILLKKSQTIYDAPLGFVVLYTHHFSISNLRLPIPLFIFDVLDYFKPSVDLLRSFLNLGRAGDWFALSNRGGADVPKALTKLFNFLPEGGLDENRVGPSASPYLETGENLKAARKRKLTVDPPWEGSHQRVGKVPAQASKVAGDASTPLDVDSDPDIHEFPSARDLKDAIDCHWVVAHVTPPSWKQYLRDIIIEQLCDIHDRAYMRQAVLDNKLNSRTWELIFALHKARASCDAIREREIKKDKAYAELEKKYNEALQDLD